MKLVSEGSGSFQVNGNGAWGVIGTNGTPLVIPENGYLGIYIVEGSKTDVWFDQLEVKVKRSQLKEENHYYPFGLPMGTIGSAAAGMTENRRKYQSNEYIKDAGLNWMDFNFRQYDPQLGRFNAVDPLAASTDMISSYAAMGNAPESQIDPNGTSNFLFHFGGDGGLTPNPIAPGSWLSDPNKAGSMGVMSGGSLDNSPSGMGEGDMSSGGGGSSDQAQITWGQIFGTILLTGGSYHAAPTQQESFTTNFGDAAPGGLDGNGGLDVNNGGGHDANLLEGVVVKGHKKGWFGKAWDWVKHKANSWAEEAASGIVLAATGVAMPIINQAHVIYKEGIHEGGAIYSENKVSWAVPYKVEGWKLVPKNSMMKENLSWDDGKDVIKATTDVLMLIEGVLPNINLPINGLPPFWQKVLNWSAEKGMEKVIEEGRDKALEGN